MSIRMASPLEPSLIGSPWHLMATTGAISPTSSYVGLSALVANYTLAVTAPHLRGELKLRRVVQMSSIAVFQRSSPTWILLAFRR